ncbi:MAG: Uma2 family endonuclease [Myxococcota bacterium]|nr:Uma2 family endonuclease [Myxococcota bacterium]
MTGPALARLTYSEYLALERASTVKHEYVDGAAIAMAGGSIEHGRLATRLAWLVQRGLEGRPCDTFGSDVRVRTPNGSAYYPDLTIVCGHLERDAEDAETITNPAVIVEVLSDSTESRDRTTKFRQYRRLPSLREYVLVSQDDPFVEVWRRESGRWALAQEVGRGATFRLEAADVEIAVDELYRDPLATA